MWTELSTVRVHWHIHVATMRTMAPCGVPPVTAYLINQNWPRRPPVNPSGGLVLMLLSRYNFALHSCSNLVFKCPEIYKCRTMLPRTHQTPRSEKLSRMKFALICIAGISGMIGVYSSPAARDTHVGIIRTPTVPEPGVEGSVSPLPHQMRRIGPAWLSTQPITPTLGLILNLCRRRR
jgi:hypothetical protein